MPKIGMVTYKSTRGLRELNLLVLKASWHGSAQHRSSLFFSRIFPCLHVLLHSPLPNTASTLTPSSIFSMVLSQMTFYHLLPTSLIPQSKAEEGSEDRQALGIVGKRELEISSWSCFSATAFPFLDLPTCHNFFFSLQPPSFIRAEF